MSESLNRLPPTRGEGGGQPEWQPIISAPRDGTTIQARIPGHGDDNMIAWIADALEDEHGACGAWTFTGDQEPPPCWSDGWCWAVNEDGARSAWPTHWKEPLPASPSVTASHSKDRRGSEHMTTAIHWLELANR